MITQEIASHRLYQPRTFSRRTKQRFRLDRMRRLERHVGAPNDMQRLIVERIIEVEWSILRLSARADDQQLSPHAARELLAFHNHLRLLTRELGLKAALPRQPSLAELMAEAQAEADPNDETA